MSSIPVVYATATASLVMGNGAVVAVQMGSHWPADDPLVRQHPANFGDDPRYGLSWTGEPPAYMSIPPGQPIPGVEDGEQRRAPRRG